jgi:hypothetical protein
MSQTLIVCLHNSAQHRTYLFGLVPVMLLLLVRCTYCYPAGQMSLSCRLSCCCTFLFRRHVEGVLDLIQQACGTGHKETPQDKLCGPSQFVAAGNRAGCAAGKDISGRFITSCSHQLVVRMLNMPSKHGRERYA